MLKSRFVPRLLVAAALAWAGLVALPATANGAEDCPRSFLDERYCDRDGNLTADLPLNEDEWVDPDTIIFSYTPVEDPAVYQKVWDGFIQHMADVTGRKVVFFPVQSYAAQYEAMRSGRLHVAGVNTGGNPIAVACAGFVPFAMMASADGSFGLRDGDHRPRRQPHRLARGSEGRVARIHLADLELRLQGPLGHTQVRVRARGRQGLQGRVLRQARQLGARRRQQGLRGRGGRQLRAQPDDRPRGRGSGEVALHLQVADLPHHRLRPRPQPAPHRRREDQAGVLHVPVGRSRICRPSSRRKASSSPSTTSRTGTSSARSTRPTASATAASEAWPKARAPQPEMERLRARAASPGPEEGQPRRARAFDSPAPCGEARGLVQPNAASTTREGAARPRARSALARCRCVPAYRGAAR